MLKIQNVTKTFNKEMSKDLVKVALDNINLEINEGDFVTIIGSNGSGKTTLLNVISGVHKIDNGNILINNKNINDLKEHQRAKFLGRVFQDPLLGTAGTMSVLENLYLANQKGRNRKLKWAFNKKEEEKFYNLVKELNLNIENNLTQKIGLLSGGQRQAITLLMATLQKPEILLLDEHTAALDPKTAEVVLNLTNELIKKHNLTTLMITHNMRDALNYGNRLIMFKEGKIVLDVKGKEKDKLTIKDLLFKFEDID
ncbi:MAG TPA: ATP-binding cassette domain-containing protein [Acholeplasma sp.]|nr:ATP-binding cassette domain-containing protein [Acholeplasma sp.]